MTRPYRNKLYVAFDGDSDMGKYDAIKLWRDNKYIDFDFYDAHDLNYANDSSKIESIKVQLRVRMDNSKAFLLLVGEKTGRNRKFIPWEIEAAQRRDLPIIVANINEERQYDSTRCPSTLADGHGAIHVAFRMKIIKKALEEWPDYHKANKAKVLANSWHYENSAYEDLGL